MNSQKPLRLWPGVAAAVLLVLFRFVLPLVAPDAFVIGLLGGLAAAAMIVIWWVFFSRAPWIERVGAIVLVVAATLLTRLIVHPSISGGLMGRMLPVYAVPATASLALVLWAIATRRLSTVPRRVLLVLAMFAGCGIWALARTDGIFGGAGSQLTWRWTPTAEERLLAQGADEPRTAPPVTPPAAPAPAAAPPAAAAAPAPPPGSNAAAVPAKPTATDDRAETRPDAVPAKAGSPAPSMPVRAEWPGFRGPGRDGVIHGVRLDLDWSKTPPKELWRRPIGPGWSSFAVQGDLIFTQEQRGEHEIVSAYRFSTGEPVWRHRDAVRFYESNGGPGPRGTPTVHNGRVYSLGATGVVNALNAATGAVVWSRNASTDTGAAVPGWGFAASPLVVDDVVIVAASGRLAAYDADSGKPRWTRRTSGGGYSSPHLVTIDGVRQVVLLSGGGATAVAPSDGAVLWQHPWADGVGIIQPALVSPGEVLIAAGDMMGGVGMRRLALAHGSGGWNAQERWTTRGLKPYFNDFVVHEDHAYGFDGTILSCISLADGERKWKGGRYGAGQMLLLPDQDVLLVLSEEGELVLVSATPDKHTEITRFKAIEGKTWNHPVLVRDVVLVRNGEEMAAFRLPLTAR